MSTYLLWLQDSSFKSICYICQTFFTESDELIRLPCFDLFHWKCFEMSLSGDVSESNCPTCRVPVLPKSANKLSKDSITIKLCEMIRKCNLASNTSTAKYHYHDALTITDHHPQPQSNRQNRDKGPALVSIEIDPVQSFFSSSITEKPKKYTHPAKQQHHSYTHVDHSILPLPVGNGGGIRTDYDADVNLGVRQVLINFVTLRNLRSVCLRISPRQVIVFLIPMIFTISLITYLIFRS